MKKKFLFYFIPPLEFYQQDDGYLVVLWNFFYYDEQASIPHLHEDQFHEHVLLLVENLSFPFEVFHLLAHLVLRVLPDLLDLF